MDEEISLDAFRQFALLSKNAQFTVIKQNRHCSRCVKNGKHSCYCYLHKTLLLQKQESQYWDEVAADAERLFASKSKLDELDLEEWSRHTDTRFPASKVKPLIRAAITPEVECPEMLTISWLKLYELLVHFDLLVASKDPIRSIHLAECPGGFVAATNHFIKTRLGSDENWQWRATSLDTWHEQNDWHEMLDNDLFYKETYGHWLRGADGTGNLMRLANFNYILNELAPKFKADLVTADGSFDTQHDAGRQEELLFPLLLSETLLALAVLKTGGCFVLKVYGLLTPVSIGLIALIANCFSEVHLTKPFLSKPGNSEMYVVAKGFVGVSSTLFDICRRYIETSPAPGTIFFTRENLQESFVAETVRAIKEFTIRQIDAIEENIRTFGTDEKLSNDEKEALATAFIEEMNIKGIPNEHLIVSEVLIGGGTVQGHCLHHLRKGNRLSVPSTYHERQEARKEWMKLQLQRIEPFVKGQGLEVKRSANWQAFKELDVSHVKSSRSFSDLIASNSVAENLGFSVHENAEHAALADLVVKKCQTHQTEDRQRYGKMLEEMQMLKPFKIVSSPFFNQDLFKDLLRLRAALPRIVPSVTYGDLCWLASRERGDVISHTSIDIALLLLRRYRQNESNPTWVEFSFGGKALSLPLQRTNCSGLLVDLAAETSVSEGVVSGTFLHDWEKFKTEMEGRLQKLGLANRGFNLAIIDPSPPIIKAELMQSEIDNQKRLLRSLRAALKFLADKGDIIIVTSSTASRFTASLLLLLATAFRDVVIYRPPTTPAWTQQRYVYCRGFESRSSARCNAVRGNINSCCVLLNNRQDPKNPKSIHFLLPPILFSASANAEWIQTTNDALAVGEHEGLRSIFEQLNFLSKSLNDPALLISPDGQTVDARRWFESYHKILMQRQSSVQSKLLSLFEFQELFMGEEGFASLIDWLKKASNLTSDWKVLHKIPFEKVGLISGSLAEARGAIEESVPALKSLDAYRGWCWDMNELIGSEGYDNERLRLFPKISPAFLGASKEHLDRIEELHNQRSSVGSRLMLYAVASCGEPKRM